MKIVNKSDVTFIDKLGTDLTVVNAARVSFAKESKLVQTGYEGYDGSVPVMGLSAPDDKLLAYLAEHDHWSPFAHAQIQIRVTAPIFVARQLVKHQIGLVWNEESRRYISDAPTFYLPSVWRGKPVNGAKQGSHGEVLLPDSMMARIYTFLQESEDIYNELMDTYEVSPEQARIFLPLDLMTSWYWTGSLYACARVCKLRLDGHAQGEATEVAVQIDQICRHHFPKAWEKLIG